MSVKFEGFTFVSGGVCAPKGFKASGVHCGIRKNKDKKDLGLICCDKDCTAAAVYTQNKVKGSPIIVTQKHLKNGIARAVIVNSGNANTCNADGEEKALLMCKYAADALAIEVEDVIVASTGVIGQVLDAEPIKEGIPSLVKALSIEGSGDAATAIMTTDTRQKEVAVAFSLGGRRCYIGGIAKGSGMIHPNMATMLCFITTDACISAELLQKALTNVTAITFNRVSVDGDTSTNDMVSILASGYAENDEIVKEDEAYERFANALYVVMMNLAREVARDGEGATKLLECLCVGAPDEETADAVSKAVICSSLVKAAMFGQDANWGRVLCAIGYADAEFDIDKVSVELASAKGKLIVCIDGAGVTFSEDAAKEILGEEEIKIVVDLHDGESQSVAWGCDLTYDYVKINGDYRT